MRRYIVLLLITGTVWAQTGLDKLVLKDGTEYLGEFSKKDKKNLYFKPEGAFAFQPVSIKLIQTLLLEDGTFFVSAGKNLKLISTIEGKAVHELSTIPQVFGSNDYKSKDFFNNFFEEVSSEVRCVSTTETAELVKLTSNVYRDVIFGFSNEISLISHKQNIDVKEVIDACNYKYPRCNIYSSGPVGGPCLSKDSYILADSIDESQTKSIILNARRLNENYVIEILNPLIKNVKKASILGISLGLSLTLGLVKYFDQIDETPVLVSIAVVGIASLIGLLDDVSILGRKEKAWFISFASLPLIISQEGILVIDLFGYNLDFNYFYFNYLKQ